MEGKEGLKDGKVNSGGWGFWGERSVRAWGCTAKFLSKYDWLPVRLLFSNQNWHRRGFHMRARVCGGGAVRGRGISVRQLQLASEPESLFVREVSLHRI